MFLKSLKFAFALPVSLFFLQGCNITESTDTRETIWIAPHKTDCHGVAPTKCYQVLKQSPNAQWQLHYGPIEGFTPDNKNFHQVAISRSERKRTAADQSSEVISVLAILQSRKSHYLPNTSLTDQRKWQLKSLTGFKSLAEMEAKNRPFMSLSTKGIAGFSGCNRFFGQRIVVFESTKVEQSMIKLANMATTRMMCHPNQVQDLETAFLKMLNNSDRLLVKWPSLILYQGKTEIAEFVASDWD